jgi:peroxiredoxin
MKGKLMSKSRFACAILISTVVTSLAGMSGCNQEEPAPAGYLSDWYGKPAPDFTVTDIEGKTFTLSEQRGKEVMVVFWATWCPPCRAEIPELVKLRAGTPESELAIIGISLLSARETTEKVKAFVSQNDDINYTIASVSESDLPVPFNSIRALPSAFFISKDGKIKAITEGLLSGEDMRELLAAT